MLVARLRRARKKDKLMDLQLYDYLENEYNSKFSGWDFSYIKDRMQEDLLPWNYKEIVKNNLTNKTSLLDIDTGGGEFLYSINNLPKNTFATEGYEPNIPIAAKRLNEKGITVKTVKNKDHLPFEDNYFDIIINRHGSYDINEIKRILKRNGIFITQQVGSLNAIDLNTSLGIKLDSIVDWCLISNIYNFNAANLNVIESNENIGKYRFYDIGAVVYYLKCVPWQVTDFNVKKYMDRLEIINKVILDKGYIDFISHRFYLIIQK
jgi:SAM-dependent methyltransferase